METQAPISRRDLLAACIVAPAIVAAPLVNHEPRFKGRLFVLGDDMQTWTEVDPNTGAVITGRA